MAERLFIARLQLAMQIMGLGLIVGAAIGLLIGGATRSVPVYWGSTWFGSETMYLAFRTITVPGHFAHAVLGKEPMTFGEFVLLNKEEGAAKTVAPEGSVFRAAQPLQEGRAPVTSRHDKLKSKWLSLVMWSLAVGALLPRLLAALYVARKARNLRTQVLLDLSDSYFKSLQRKTIAHQRQSNADQASATPTVAKKVWWKPGTWFHKAQL